MLDCFGSGLWGRPIRMNTGPMKWCVHKWSYLLLSLTPIPLQGMRRTHRSSTTSRPSLDHAMVCPGSSHLPYPEDKSISKTVVHFEEASYLAQGSSGEVHRARLDGHKGPVAVKAFRLPRNATERHRSEIVSERRACFSVDRPTQLMAW